MTYDVKDISLAPQGKKKIDWVRRHMPVLEHIKKKFAKEKPFEGITIGSCLHLEPKTINLGLTLQAGGAEVAMTGCNPLSTQGWRSRPMERMLRTIWSCDSSNPR